MKIHGIDVPECTQYQKAILEGVEASLLTSALLVIDEYNESQKVDSYRLQWPHVVEFIRRCKRYDLDPMEDALSFYLSKGKLTMVIELETYIRKASMTGQLVTLDRFTRVREDRKVIACCKVIRRTADGVDRLFTGEANVEQWHSMNVDGKTQPTAHWKHTPESQAMNAAIRQAIRVGFADVLYAMPDVIQLDKASAIEDDDQTQPTAKAASTPVPPDIDSARDKLDRARSGSTSGASPAPAPATPPASNKPEEAPAAPPAPSSAEPETEAICQRAWGMTFEQLDGAKKAVLQRFLSSGPATTAEINEVETCRQMFGKTADEWDAFCEIKARNGQAAPYNHKWLLSADAKRIIAKCEELARKGAL